MEAGRTGRGRGQQQQRQQCTKRKQTLEGSSAARAHALAVACCSTYCSTTLPISWQPTSLQPGCMMSPVR